MLRRIILSLTFISVFIPLVQAQDNVQVLGTIVGRERLYGHVYGQETVTKRILIVRVDKIIKGVPHSKYILIKYHWRLMDKESPYNGNSATQWTLNLTREADCDSTLEKLQFGYFGDKKVTGIFPRIDKALSIESENLPFETVLPCYQLKPGDFSTDQNFSASLNKTTWSDTEIFVLKESLVMNPFQAPIEIGVEENGLYYLVNRSKKTITSYTLSCLTKEEGKIIIKDKLNIEETILTPNYSVHFPRGSDGALNYIKELKACYDKKSKFSVVEVKFDDKTSWQAR